uniref:Transposase n=1 Tax=Steinernema glaseri TaxID=37863 RepID=A0A1I8A9G6_9BILA
MMTEDDGAFWEGDGLHKHHKTTPGRRNDQGFKQFDTQGYAARIFLHLVPPNELLPYPTRRHLLPATCSKQLHVVF